MSQIRESFEAAFPDASEIERFRSALADWFRHEGRDYPWRSTCDPYAILVSEMMLQQTQVATVLGRGYYRRWLERFPDWKSLAEAEEGEVLKAWEGLGYYNRARYLQRAARAVLSDCGGSFPRDVSEMIRLPGVGRYTAGAVASFAFDLPVPIVDGNVARVLARLFACADPVDRRDTVKALWEWAGRLVPPEGGRLHNSAIMELGQRVCLPASPACGACPVRFACRAADQGKARELPVKSARPAAERRDERVGICLREGAVLLVEERGTRRRGLWRLPRLSEEECADLEETDCFIYPITRYRVTLRVYDLPVGSLPRVAESDEGSWHAIAHRGDWPAMGAPYAKAVESRLLRMQILPDTACLP